MAGDTTLKMGNRQALTGFPTVLLGLWFVLSLPISTVGEERGDVLLLRHPHRAVIYNKYQVTLGPKDHHGVVAYAPLRIVRHDAILPDGFTHTIQVSSEGEQFYILKEENGMIASAAQPLLFQDVVFVTDTVRVMRSGAVTLVTPDKSNRRLLAKDQLLFSEFRTRDQVYVRAAATLPFYGWVSLPPQGKSKTWEYVHAVRAVTKEFPRAIIDSVRVRLQTANVLLDSLFARLNVENGERLSPPTWRLSAYDARLICELEPASQAHAFQETTEMVAKDIETILLGTTVAVTVAPGKITLWLNE